MDAAHYKIEVGFGSRYYLNKNSNVKPYLQLGINQQTEYINYSYWGPTYDYRYFMNLGVGFNVKISKKFSFDMKYHLNKSLENTSYSFNGFSVLGGIKYNL